MNDQRQITIMKNRSGRTAKTMSFSVTPEQERDLNRRVQELKPRVANRSNYLQQLFSLEVRYRLLEPSRKRKPRLRLFKESVGRKLRATG